VKKPGLDAKRSASPEKKDDNENGHGHGGCHSDLEDEIDND
jgi:hypothetical protein